MTVDLDGLTSGQTYYCKAAATNSNSSSCVGVVIGDVKMFLISMTALVPTTWPSLSTAGKYIQMCSISMSEEFIRSTTSIAFHSKYFYAGISIEVKCSSMAVN